MVVGSERIVAIHLDVELKADCLNRAPCHSLDVFLHSSNRSFINTYGVGQRLADFVRLLITGKLPLAHLRCAVGPSEPKLPRQRKARDG